MSGSLALANLKRLLDARAELSADVCSVCGVDLPTDHPHVADIESRTLRCICPNCHAQTAGNGWRTIPQRFLRLPPHAITEDDWNAFEIPVGMAFFFYNSSLQRTVACYPSPAGAIESLLPTERWERVLGAMPGLALAPDVEALLVRRTREASESYVVPIVTCYELAGRIRQRWSGFGGGPEALAEIEGFFRMLRDRCEEVDA